MADTDKDLEKLEDEELHEDEENQDDQQDSDQSDDHEDQQDDEHEEADDQDDSDDSDEEDEEEKPKPSRREQLRIQQLLKKMKEDSPSTQKKTDDTNLNLDDDLDADDATKSKLKSDRESYGEKRYSQGVEEAYRFSRFETRLEVDAPRVEAKYPQLDKESDDFNPVLADTINRMYLSFVGFDPKKRSVRTSDIRYAEYVDSVYELASEIAGDSVERTTTNVKKQAAKTGLRPGGGGQKRLNLNKAPQDMTDEELEAVINAAMPPKKR